MFARRVELYVRFPSRFPVLSGWPAPGVRARRTHVVETTGSKPGFASTAGQRCSNPRRRHLCGWLSDTDDVPGTAKLPSPSHFNQRKARLGLLGVGSGGLELRKFDLTKRSVPLLDQQNSPVAASCARSFLNALGNSAVEERGQLSTTALFFFGRFEVLRQAFLSRSERRLANMNALHLLLFAREFKRLAVARTAALILMFVERGNLEAHVERISLFPLGFNLS